MALNSGKKTVQGTGRGLMNIGLVAAATVFQGGIAMLASGFGRAARVGQGGNDLAKIADVATYRVLGVGQASLTGGASDGVMPLDVQSGDWVAKNSAGVDAITVAQIGHYCFIVDDETVARHSASGTRPRAGVVIAVDSTGVLVRMAPEIAAAAPRSVFLPFAINATDLAAPTTAELVSPVSGTILRMTTIVQTAIVTGGTITALVGTTTVAGLACAIADAAAKGSVVTGTPTLGDATTQVAAGGRIQIAPDAPFNGGGAVSGILEIGF
ncbi:hypothetical protein DBR17_17795 [Sphingomonas sp. HMWF008]|nr:hypothetical protein DBR17_17795 [Sphingomonas sp. HMWF008]